MAVTSWLVKVANIFLTSVIQHGRLWLQQKQLFTALNCLEASLLLPMEA